MKLTDLRIGETATIKCIESGNELYIRRLRGMGLKAGASIKILRKGLTGSPLHVKVNNTELAIRSKDAEIIHIF